MARKGRIRRGWKGVRETSEEKQGFQVTLARNKLDGNDYAVKRIALFAGKESMNRRVKKEAKLFSKLNHPNVVRLGEDELEREKREGYCRYFSAWVEDVSDEKGRTKNASE